VNIREFPYPVSHAWELANDKSSGAAVRHINAIGCVYQILRLSALPLASWYLYKMPDHPSLNRPLSFLQRPMMGNWLGFVRSAIKNVYLEDRKQDFLPLFPLVQMLNQLFAERWMYEADEVDPFSWFIRHRNSHHGHFSTLTDREAERALQIVLPKLDELLEMLKCFGQYQLLHYDRSAATVYCLHALQGDGSFAQVTYLDHELFHNVDGIVLFEPSTGQLVPLTHLLVQESDEDQFEGLVGFRTATVQMEPLLFDGIERSKGSVVYLGSGSRKHRTANYQDVLNAFDVKLRAIGQSSNYSAIERLRFESEEQLASVYGAKYLPQTYITRDIENSLIKTLSRNTPGNRPAVLLIGTSGSGKSSLLCHLADKFLKEEGEKNQVSLRIAEVVGNETTVSLTQGVAFDLGYRGTGEALSLRKVLEHWSSECSKLNIKNPKLWVLWDAINEGHDFKQLVGWLDEAAQTFYEWNMSSDTYGKVFLIASCRNEPWEQLVYDAKKDNPDSWPIENIDAFVWSSLESKEQGPFWLLKPFSLKQACAAYSEYKSWAQLSREPHSLIHWKDIPYEQKQMMRKPLNVWLFHQCFQGMETPPLGSLSTSGLWQKYLEQLVVKHPLMGDALILFGDTMWRNSTAVLSIEMLEKIQEEALLKQQASVLASMGLTQEAFDVLPEMAQQTLLKSQPGLLETFNPVELLQSTGLLQFKEDGSVTPIYQTLTEALAVWTVWDDLIPAWDPRSRDKELRLDSALGSLLASDPDAIDQKLQDWSSKANWDEGRLALSYIWAKAADVALTSGMFAIAIKYLKELQLRGFTGNVTDLINSHISSIDETHRLEFQSILIDIVHLRGDYRLASEMIEKELSSYSFEEQMNTPLLISLNIRNIHHKMFFSPVDDLWEDMKGLLDHVDRSRFPAFYGEVLVMLGGNLGTLKGNYLEARSYLVKAVRLGEEIRDQYLVTRALRKYFDYLRYAGHFTFAQHCFEKVWQLSESKQRTRQGIYMLCCHGDMKRQLGNLDVAEKEVKEALGAAEETYIPGWIGHCHLALAEIAFEKGDMTGAGKSLALAKSFYEVAHQAWGMIQVNAGEARLAREDCADCLRLLEKGLAEAERLGYFKEAEYLNSLKEGNSFQHCLMFL